MGYFVITMKLTQWHFVNICCLANPTMTGMSCWFYTRSLWCDCLPSLLLLLPAQAHYPWNWGGNKFRLSDPMLLRLEALTCSYWYLLLSSFSFSCTWLNLCQKKWECRKRRWACQHWSYENWWRTNTWHSRAAFNHTCEKNESKHIIDKNKDNNLKAHFKLCLRIMIFSYYKKYLCKHNVWGSLSQR